MILNVWLKVWLIGGYELLHSGDILEVALDWIHILLIKEYPIERKNSRIEIVEIIAPAEDQMFHEVNESG